MNQQREGPRVELRVFCGGPANYMENGDFRLHVGHYFAVCCENHCRVAPHTGWSLDRDIAITAWETRA